VKQAFKTTVISGILANLLVLSVLLWAILAQAHDSAFYHQSLQEDGVLEWMTFWAFILAAVAFLCSALASQRVKVGLPWFEFGLALFCFIVAMEEISWGQRVFGYRAPEYFLANNFQQELNAHNVFDISLRKLTLKGVILGYGVVLPLLGLFPLIKRAFEQIGIKAPTCWLLPAFTTTYWIYEVYPWRFSGELTELMLGFCFLFAAVGFGKTQKPAGQSSQGWVWIAASAILVAVLSCINAAISNAVVRADPATLEAARIESSTLAQDLRKLTRGNYGRRAKIGRAHV